MPQNESLGAFNTNNAVVRMGERWLLIGIFMLLWVGSCTSGPSSEKIPAEGSSTAVRAEVIPAGAEKITPAEDAYPPILHVSGWSQPVPLDGPINTAGAEDSPFVSPDGERFFFFFTPDVNVPVEQQLLDGVTGIYESTREGDSWGTPERVELQDAGKLALDGCAFFDGETLWFCTAREGLTGLHWFKADVRDGGWTNWRLADFKDEYEVGELHIYGDELFFHSTRAGGAGEMDLWVSQRVNDVWQPPNNLDELNSAAVEGYPFISPDGQELWFTRWYEGTPAIFRSERVEGGWSPPELIISRFAGEPTLDPQGNIYFVHHFYDQGEMLEADIYVAYKR